VQRWRRLADGAAAPEKRHASTDGHDVDRFPEALWKLMEALAARIRPARVRKSTLKLRRPTADTRIGPAGRPDSRALASRGHRFDPVAPLPPPTRNRMPKLVPLAVTGLKRSSPTGSRRDHTYVYARQPTVLASDVQRSGL